MSGEFSHNELEPLAAAVLDEAEGLCLVRPPDASVVQLEGQSQMKTEFSAASSDEAEERRAEQISQRAEADYDLLGHHVVTYMQGRLARAEGLDPDDLTPEDALRLSDAAMITLTERREHNRFLYQEYNEEYAATGLELSVRFARTDAIDSNITARIVKLQQAQAGTIKTVSITETGSLDGSEPTTIEVDTYVGSVQEREASQAASNFLEAQNDPQVLQALGQIFSNAISGKPAEQEIEALVQQYASDSEAKAARSHINRLVSTTRGITSSMQFEQEQPELATPNKDLRDAQDWLDALRPA